MSTATAVRERPIIMSAPMVRAILDGTKTQTRRVVKPQFGNAAIVESRGSDGGWTAYGDNPTQYDGDVQMNEWRVDFKCPFGVPGDQLWVREAWQFADWTEDGYPFIGYRAADARVLRDKIPHGVGEHLEETWIALSKPSNYAIDNRAADRRWRPSIFMPRWASRLTLELIEVRVERLQDISEEDALGEGIEVSPQGRREVLAGIATARIEYARLWDSLNAKRAPWESNPWVWVLAFRRIDA